MRSLDPRPAVSTFTLAALAVLMACDVSPNDDMVSEDDGDAMQADPAEDEEDEETPNEVPAVDDSGDDDETIYEHVPLDVYERTGDCLEYGEEAMCLADGALGVQFCHPEAGGWGPCLVAPECALDEVKLEVCGPSEEPDELGCELQAGRPRWEECGFTPLVFSFDGREPTFDAAPAAFELSAGDHACFAREMPGADTPWLAIDRDGSGTIDNGSELFGTATPTADGHVPSDGFEALAELDSNHDGRISAADAAWPALLLWSDYDRDRKSGAWELMSVADAGLTEIELAPRVERRCDGRGNCGIERSAFRFDTGIGAPSAGTVVDVHIPCD